MKDELEYLSRVDKVLQVQEELKKTKKEYAARIQPIQQEFEKRTNPLERQMAAYREKAYLIAKTCAYCIPDARKHFHCRSVTFSREEVRIEVDAYCGEGHYEKDKPIRFPLHWLEAPVEVCVAELHAFYAAKKAAESAKTLRRVEREAEERKEQERAEYLRLKALFENTP